MTPQPATLHESDSMATAIARMSKGGFRRMPIVDEQGRPKGMVKVSGILHYLVEHFPTRDLYAAAGPGRETPGTRGRVILSLCLFPLGPTCE